MVVVNFSLVLNEAGVLYRAEQVFRQALSKLSRTRSVNELFTNTHPYKSGKNVIRDISLLIVLISRGLYSLQRYLVLKTP